MLWCMVIAWFRVACRQSFLCKKLKKLCFLSVFLHWMDSIFLFHIRDTTSEFGDHFSERDLGSLMQSSVSLAEIKVGETGTVISMMLLKSTVTAFQKYLCSYFISL